MKYAIVESGGKQYKAVEGTTIDVDLLEVEIGTPVNLETVFCWLEDEKITVGTPSVKGAKITTSVLDHVKGPKVDDFQVLTKETDSCKDRASPAVHPTKS